MSVCLIFPVRLKTVFIFKSKETVLPVEQRNLTILKVRLLYHTEFIDRVAEPIAVGRTHDGKFNN